MWAAAKSARAGGRCGCAQSAGALSSRPTDEDSPPLVTLSTYTRHEENADLARELPGLARRNSATNSGCFSALLEQTTPLCPPPRLLPSGTSSCPQLATLRPSSWLCDLSSRVFKLGSCPRQSLRRSYCSDALLSRKSTVAPFRHATLRSCSPPPSRPLRTVCSCTTFRELRTEPRMAGHERPSAARTS